MILTYEKYVEMIKEGWMFTHNIQRYHSNIEIELNSIGVKNNILIQSKFVYELEILNPDELSDEILEFAINLNQNILGYYPSYIWCRNKNGINSFKYEDKYLSCKYSYLKIRFEAKYEDGMYSNDLEVPEIAYHLSKMSKREKILRNGLCPKSYNRKTKHPERTYLFYDLDDYVELLKSLKFNDRMTGEESKYILYKVLMSDDMVIHTDPNYEKGFYTNDNINPLNLEILKENL